MEKNFGGNLKLIVIGDSFTGKTSLVMRWTGNKYNDKYKATIISEFGAKYVEMDNILFKVQLWDLAGQDRTIYLTKYFTKDCVGALVLCEAKNPKSLANSTEWIKRLIETSKSLAFEDIPVVLAENKSDLLTEEEIADTSLKKFADENNFVGSFRTSAKTGYNVDECMKFLVRAVFEKLKSEGKLNAAAVEKGKNLKTQSSNYRERKKNSCC